MAVDLSVYDRQRSLADYMRKNAEDAFNKRLLERKLQLDEVQAKNGGQDPAAVKIVNDMQNAARAARDPNLSPSERAIASHRYSLLNQVSKSFAIDRGMDAEIPGFYGSPQPSQQPAAPAPVSGDPQGDFAQALAEMDKERGLSPMTGSIPSGGVSAIPGYANTAGSIAATKKRMETKAQKDVELDMNPKIEEKTKLAGGRAQNIVDEEAVGLKKTRQAGDTVDYLSTAEALLPRASGGLGGTALSFGKGLAGVSDETTQANEQLKLISGWLVANVPRMEGPQSNFDVLNYQKMAADVGNSMKPIGDRLAALQTLRSLNEKYAPSDQSQGQPQQASGPMPGDVVDGYVYVGGDPGQESSWKKATR